MPFSTEHVPWSQRTRRQKAIIVVFYSLMLTVAINIVGWIAFLCVFKHNEKYAMKMSEEKPKDKQTGAAVARVVSSTSFLT